MSLISRSRSRRFVGGSSAKFWEVAVVGSDVTVRYGRLGTEGQSLTKSIGDAASAGRHAEKPIGEKTAKGHVETAVA